MSGIPAFQASPTAFQQNAFQTGVNVVAGDYSVASPAFAVPVFKLNYQLSVTAAYALGSPAFATPLLATLSLAFTVNPYSVGAPTYAVPGFRTFQRLNANSFSVGAPTYSVPTWSQRHKLFANSMGLGGLDFGEVHVPINVQCLALTYSLGPLTYAPPQVAEIFYTLHANAYSLQLKFGWPRLTFTVDAFPVPMTYYTQVQQAAVMLQDFLNVLLSSIPATPQTPNRNNVRRLISILRANAEKEIRGTTLGTQLQDIFAAAYSAGATYAGVERTRQYLMTQVAGQSIFTQLIFRSALIMTLALQSQVITRLVFKTQDQIRNMILHMRDAFEQARAIGIDEVDVLVYQTLTTMSGALINHLAVTELQLPRTLTYTMQMPMPSLYLANRIYHDTSRADELEIQNGVIHPAFMPRKLKVLSNAGR